MPDNAVATVRQLEIFHGDEKRLGLHLDSLRKQLSSAGSKEFVRGSSISSGWRNQTTLLFSFMAYRSP